MLIHAHIPKTAGSSFNKVLEDNFLDTGYFFRPNDFEVSVSKFLNKNENEILNYKAVWGHVRYSFDGGIIPDPHWVSFIRDPIDLTLSYYNFILQNKDHISHTAFKSKSFLELISNDTYGITNCLTEFFSGDVSGDIEKRFEKARKNIKNFTLGVTEKYAESLNFICDKFNLKNREIYFLNVLNEVGKLKYSLDPETMSFLKEINKHDSKLYNIGLELFEKQLVQ